MELITDILAILGWALIGATIPCTTIFSCSESDGEIASKVLSVAFGLIAASLVLG